MAGLQLGLYGLAAAYLIVGALHSIYFTLFISRADCIAAASGIVYVFCHTGVGLSHLVSTLAWPWHWFQ